MIRPRNASTDFNLDCDEKVAGENPEGVFIAVSLNITKMIPQFKDIVLGGVTSFALGLDLHAI